MKKRQINSDLYKHATGYIPEIDEQFKTNNTFEK